jgi:GNAT superfamily N-acetyltransferase
MELLIQALGEGDLERLLALYRHLHARDEAPPEAAPAIWQQILGDPQQIYLGAFADGLLVAACNAAVVPNLTRGGRPYALIENVVTHADYRRRGIASRLMRALMDRCWRLGCYKLMLLSAAERAEAHEFYAALGFDGALKKAFVVTAR